MVIFHKNKAKIDKYYKFLKKNKGEIKELNVLRKIKELYPDFSISSLGNDIDKKDEDIKKLENLEEYESFKGRIDFSYYIDLFNFEKNIYPDKQFKYSLISNNNKRLIPEFISAACAKLIYDGLIDIDIRIKLEQYLIAILSNLDYRNYATLEQLKNEFKNDQGTTNFYNILTSCPLTYNKDEKFQIIIKQRINIATGFLDKDEKADIEIYGEDKSYYKNIKSSVSTEKLNVTEIDDKMPKSKLTKTEIKNIFKGIENNLRNESKYNLILFTSTFHISKVAHEIEKYFYEETELRYPDNIFIIGDEAFFGLITNREIEDKKPKNKKTQNEKIPSEKEIQDEKEKEELIRIKKMQSFLFEIFMHALDKNRQK